MTLYTEDNPPPHVTDREAALRRAARYTTQDRNNTYGPPEDSFKMIAEGWNWWLGDKLAKPLTALDVAEMLSLMKKARRRYNPGHLDSYDDDLGYVACAAEIGGKLSSGKPVGR